MELTAKVISWLTAINPIPIITKQTSDSINVSPLFDFIYCNIHLSFFELYLYLDKDLSSLKNPKRVLNEGTALKIEDMLLETVNALYGTGRKAGVSGLLIAGKTGTAERIVKNEKEYTATFSGYSVERDPSLLIVVVLRGLKGELHSGGEVAAPTFSEIMNKSMRTL